MALRHKSQEPVLLAANGKPATMMTPEEFDRLIKSFYGSKDDVGVTKELADHILDHYNIGNRRVRERHANGFAETIEEDRWVNTGESVIFSNKQRLHSGQHRLLGVRKSGKSVVMDFRFGIEPKAFALTDTGAKRLAGDVISRYGAYNPFATAAAVKLVLAWEEGLPGAYSKYAGLDNDRIVQGYFRFKQGEKSIDVATSLNKDIVNRRGFVNSASNAFSYLALLQTDVETLSEFLSILESGVTDSTRDPPRLLRERLREDPEMAKNDRSSIVKKFALYVRAWNSWRLKERPKNLLWTHAQPFPAIDVELPPAISLEDATKLIETTPLGV